MIYDMNFMNSSNTLADIVSGMNTTVGAGILPFLFLVGLYLLLLASFRSYETTKTFIISGFITSVVASLFLFLGLVAWWIVMIFVIIFLASVLIHFFT